MEVQYFFDSGFPYFLVEDYYTKEEQSFIKRELDFLLRSLKDPEDTGTATDPSDSSRPLKQNKGIFLDTVYTDRDFSDILRINRKLFSFLEEQKENVDSNDWFFKNQSTCRDTTLLSYYETNDKYEPHRDTALYTSLCWFYTLPKSFSGGNLSFTEYGIEIECIHNRMIVFPSCIRHEVSSVEMEEGKEGKGYGRWCLTQFGSN